MKIYTVEGKEFTNETEAGKYANQIGAFLITVKRVCTGPHIYTKYNFCDECGQDKE